MNDTDQLEIYIKEDKEIRDLLIQESVIDYHRVVRCGQFINTERHNTPTKPVRSHPTFCMRYQCRVCRRKLIDRQRKKHYSNNKEFVDGGGSILMLTLPVPHYKEETLPSIHERFKKSMSYLKRESYGWKKIKKITNQIFNYNSIELTEKNNGYNLHNHLIIGIKNNDVSLSTIENILFDTWSKITNKFGFDKVSRKCINVTNVTNTLGGHSGSRGDKSIEDLSKRKGTLENYERKFKETYESPSSQFRTKKLKQIGNEIKTINTTFSKRTRRGRIRKITREELIHK